MIEEVHRHLAELERELNRVANNPMPTVPIYDPADLPQDAVNGQVAIGTDTKLYWYSNDAWHHHSGVPST